MKLIFLESSAQKAIVNAYYVGTCAHCHGLSFTAG